MAAPVMETESVNVALIQPQVQPINLESIYDKSPALSVMAADMSGVKDSKQRVPNPLVALALFKPIMDEPIMGQKIATLEQKGGEQTPFGNPDQARHTLRHVLKERFHINDAQAENTLRGLDTILDECFPIEPGADKSSKQTQSARMRIMMAMAEMLDAHEVGKMTDEEAMIAAVRHGIMRALSEASLEGAVTQLGIVSGLGGAIGEWALAKQADALNKLDKIEELKAKMEPYQDDINRHVKMLEYAKKLGIAASALTVAGGLLCLKFPPAGKVLLALAALMAKTAGILTLQAMGGISLAKGEMNKLQNQVNDVHADWAESMAGVAVTAQTEVTLSEQAMAAVQNVSQSKEMSTDRFMSMIRMMCKW